MATKSQLLTLLGFVQEDEITVGEAVAALAALGIDVPVVATATLVALAIWLGAFIVAEFEEGDDHMACNSYHSTKTPGAGLCCQAVQSGALTPPPAGTILPVYTPGQANTLPPGRIVQVTDSGGHCASCMIVGSKSTKHQGRPVLKYIRGGPTCPSATTGCCTLAPLSLVQSL